MSVQYLSPSLDQLRQEYVLVQAWKKVSSYIRYHNWYSDTLELDRVAVNLPQFLKELSRQLESPDDWTSDPLRIVPAPKSQAWHIDRTGRWAPIKPRLTAAKLRPLAHVRLKDQVVAAALMLCLADRVETRQGDPRLSARSAATRKTVVSYGNRLYCDADGSLLHHRWGSSKLYRAYYQDYRSFLTRPDMVAAELAGGSAQVVILHSDLSQFYDRVRPAMLGEKLDELTEPGDDPQFAAFAKRVLNWSWDSRDDQEVREYATKAELNDFSRIALPQGLVASGFFANLVLLDFDDAVRLQIGNEIAPGMVLQDISRYVDDLRLVLTLDPAADLPRIEEVATTWIADLLNTYAPGLIPKQEKTQAAEVNGQQRPLIKQSIKMARIQRAVSGGFDALGGEEILDAIAGLLRSQERYPEDEEDDNAWALRPIPDVRDSTVARFGAARFRSTYRSLRPLLAEAEPVPTDAPAGDVSGAFRDRRTRVDLDNDARTFALGLIESWVLDPSNVRLLRIGLDLWPAADVLRRVLDLLRPFTEKGGKRKAPRRVAWYCLAEILRAGATETGFVRDEECLPQGVDLGAYRSMLAEEAIRLLALPGTSIPWYLKQQALLLIAAHAPNLAIIRRVGNSPEGRPYRELIRFLRGQADSLTGSDFAIHAVVARRAFVSKAKAIELTTGTRLTTRRLEQIAERDPAFALELIEAGSGSQVDVAPRIRDDLCLGGVSASREGKSLAEVILNGGPRSPVRNELSLLGFARLFLEVLASAPDAEAVTPKDVLITLDPLLSGRAEVSSIKIASSRVTPEGSMYRPPPWCEPGDRWRFHLGYLLRFMLSGQPDFTRIVKPPHWKESEAIYRPAESHWYQRIYGLFNAQIAFGDDWLPISDWFEQFLSALLDWPGRRDADCSEWIREGVSRVQQELGKRVAYLSGLQGNATGLLILPLRLVHAYTSSNPRPFRACIVQTVLPRPDDFGKVGLTLSDPTYRRRHRGHLSAAMEAVKRLLNLRCTHEEGDGKVDLLVLPELAVHPQDVLTHLVPFARAHRAAILAGLTYEQVVAGRPLVNSAIWIIPVWSPSSGLRVLIRRQGKHYLAPVEEEFNAGGSLVESFRPCQWVVHYEWPGCDKNHPLRMTASVCYDATDVRLAADLRDKSDVFVIPALNRDVDTFDHMALALHYHMFQFVVVANNGTYGGSNAYAPFKDHFKRQVFHLHGQPQASVAFFEIEHVKEFLSRTNDAKAATATAPGIPGYSWKYPPAGT